MVDLGVSLTDFFRNEVTEWIASDIESPDGLGQYMGILGDLYADKPDDAIRIMVSTLELRFVVTSSDVQAGQASTYEVVMKPASAVEIGRTRVVMSSQLDSVRHDELIRRLLERL